MKYLVPLLLAPCVALAQSPLLARPGAQGTLTVQYQYSSRGSYVSPSKDQKHDWQVSRTVNITAQMQASPPQPIAAMHEADQRKQTQELQKRAASIQKKAEPTMNDMMAIAERCGDNEACITKAVSEYGMSMSSDQVNDLKSIQADVNDMMGDARYQMWQLVSQKGTYTLDETYHRQVYEMTCTDKAPCRSEEVRKGGGPLPLPPGAKAGVGVAMLEVDATRKDMVILLPVPLMPLDYTRTLTANLPDEDRKSGVSKGLAPNYLAKASERFTVSIPAGTNAMSGTRTLKLDGDDGEGGTLAIHWTFTRQ
jgi:hypothetical protein